MGDTPYLDAGDDELSGISDWKAVLRVVHHELNNSLTPVLSLARSAPRLLGQPGSEQKLERIRVRRREDGAVEILVRDGGSGIPARTLSRTGVLFSSTKPGGSGVGLALSRALVEGHGGQMQLRNHPAGGVEVSIRLPDPSCRPS